jgi:hypothetical protein
MPKKNLSTEEILEKYKRKIEEQVSSSPSSSSKEYSQFKQEMIPEISRYERLASTLGSLIKLKIAEKDRIKIERHLTMAHINVSPSQALTLSVVSMFSAFFSTLLIAVAIYFINGTIPLLFVFLGVLTSLFIFYYTFTMPKRLANAWRLKASSQMVPALLYIVIYMKHTSNLERAIAFASDHLEGPLALDFKKIFYDVQIGHFSSIKQSLDFYLQTWRRDSPEFIEAMHLVESSLFEPSDNRRIQTLEKALQVMLDGVHEKMLKYSREIRSPLTNIYMLGIILPTLGLALLPLASALLQGAIQWIHVLVVFNILIPFSVFYMTSEVLLKRPGGHGESEILEKNPNYPIYISRKPWLIAALISLPLLIIGLLPLLLQVNFITSTLNIPSDFTFSNLGIDFLSLGEIKLFDFQIIDGQTLGPFGPGATLLSLFIPLSIALFFSTSYKRKTTLLMEARNSTKSLEQEFTNSLFQLGNRIGDGNPAEVAFGKIAQSTSGLSSQNFFSVVNSNIQHLGFSLERAIFDKKRGAIIYYPSSLISTSMRILVESVKKGLKVAASSLMSISEYVKNIQKINQRLRDLLAEIVSDMKSNMVFLAPLLAGIVVGLSSMIASILNKLRELISLSPGQDVAGFNIGNLPFDVTTMIPPYFLQISVGIYMIEIIFILTAALVTVDSGKDTLKEKSDLAKNLKRGLFLYTAVAFLSILALTILSVVALGGVGG